MRCLLALALSAFSVVAYAEAPTQAVGIDERVGASVPRELVFVTPDGTPHQLGEYVGNGPPTLLVFAYARCRALCSVVLESTQRLLRASTLRAGRDYRPLLVSLDPRQALEDARRQQATLLTRLGLGADTFPYLLGKPARVEALAAALGYRYAWDARTEQVAHPAVLIVLDRAGRVRRYLHALGTGTDELTDALRDADGPAPALQASLAGDLLRCFRFDPALRQHHAAIQTYFRIGGALIFVALAGLVLGLVRWERRR